MSLFRTSKNLLYENALFPGIEGVDVLACSHEKHGFFIGLAVGDVLESLVAKEFDRGVKSKVPQPEGIILGGGEEEVLVVR